jgi:hypothetical protein
MVMIDWWKGLFAKKQTVGEVLEAYGDLLVKYPLSIVDVSMLPLPKTKMKVVLKSLYAKAKTKDQETLLENGFFFLSNFQDGVGSVPIDGALLKGDPMKNLDANQAILEKWMPWQKLALAELDILSSEWNRFKAGEPI